MARTHVDHRLVEQRRITAAKELLGEETGLAWCQSPICHGPGQYSTHIGVEYCHGSVKGEGCHGARGVVTDAWQPAQGAPLIGHKTGVLVADLSGREVEVSSSPGITKATPVAQDLGN